MPNTDMTGMLELCDKYFKLIIIKLKNLWDKRSNNHVIGAPEREEKEQSKKVLREIMAQTS